MPNSPKTGRANKVPGSPGRKASATSNPAGRASRPKGGRKIPTGSSVGKGKTIAVRSGSSGRATKVGGKQK